MTSKFTSIDPVGVVCVLLTYLLVLYADYVVVRWIVMQSMYDTLWGAFHAISFNGIVFLLFMAHSRAVFSDPGIVPLPENSLDFSDYRINMNHPRSSSTSNENPNNVNWTVCSRCETYRPPQAHHCRVCQRCIRKMDHHCPWINNCVGEFNQKYFLQFLLYVGFLSLYSLCLLTYIWFKSISNQPPVAKPLSYTLDSDLDSFQMRQTRIIHCVILTLESILFGLFVVAIFVDQLGSIFADCTPIDRMQIDRDFGEGWVEEGLARFKRSKMQQLAEVCGKGSMAVWLFPCHNRKVCNVYQGGGSCRSRFDPQYCV